MSNEGGSAGALSILILHFATNSKLIFQISSRSMYNTVHPDMKAVDAVKCILFQSAKVFKVKYFPPCRTPIHLMDRSIPLNYSFQSDDPAIFSVMQAAAILSHKATFEDLIFSHT